jgi:hypothetical protein
MSKKKYVQTTTTTLWEFPLHQMTMNHFFCEKFGSGHEHSNMIFF